MLRGPSIFGLASKSSLLDSSDYCQVNCHQVRFPTSYLFSRNPQRKMKLKQDSVIALKSDVFEFLEVRSSQPPSTCDDVRMVVLNTRRARLAVNGSWPGTPHPDPGVSVFFLITSASSIQAIIFTLPPHLSHFAIYMRNAARLRPASGVVRGGVPPTSSNRLCSQTDLLSLLHPQALRAQHIHATCCWTRTHRESATGRHRKVDPGPRHHGCKPPHELHKAKNVM